MKKAFPQVFGALGGEDDWRAQLSAFLFGEGIFDHRNRFRVSGSDVDHEVTGIHISREERPGVPGGETQLKYVLGERFDTPPFIYLENEKGEMFGWTCCKGAVGFRSMYGVILEDDAGDAWFWGRNAELIDRVPYELRHQAFDELFRISTETLLAVEGENGIIREDLPAEGEFALSLEDLPVITAIPWWSGLDHSDEILSLARSKVADLKREEAMSLDEIELG